MDAMQSPTPIPPKGDRVYFYITGRIPTEYRRWAEEDIASATWTRREWIRIFLVLIVIRLVSIQAGSALFSRSFLIASGFVVLIFQVTTSLRRQLALRRIRRTLPSPTATGSFTDPDDSDQRPDPMQSFYAARRR